MQAFLPYESFAQSAAVLDMRRLNKQRIEVKQILQALDRGPGAPWSNHPAVRMWAGYETALAAYGVTMCQTWIERGGKDRINLLGQLHARALWGTVQGTYVLPPWLGHPEFHASHRANLLRKDPDWYGQWGWTEQPAEGYWWPTKNGF